MPYLPAAAAARYLDLAAEPDESVFADGDGLDPYRRLLAVSAERLTCGGALLFQLHRHVVSARRDELSAVRRVFDRAGYMPAPIDLQRLDRAAA